MRRSGRYHRFGGAASLAVLGLAAFVGGFGVAAVLALVLASSNGARSDEPTVMVSIAPLRGLVEPLAEAAGLRTELLVPASAGAHSTELPPSKIAALTNAELVVGVGAGLEPTIGPFAPAAEADADRLVLLANATDEPSRDAHMWLDPVRAHELVRAVAERLTAQTPVERHDAIAAARDELLERIDALHGELAACVEGVEDPMLVVSRPAFGVLASRYGVRQGALRTHCEGEVSPALVERAIAELRGAARPVMFRSPGEANETLERIASTTGAQTQVLDPIGNGDWFAMMESNLASWKRAFAGDGSEHAGAP